MGLILIALGIYEIVTISSNLNPRNTINAIFQIIFGIFNIVAELRVRRALKYFYFMQHFLGLGMYYIFLGGLALGGAWYEYAVAGVCFGVGLVYFILGLGCRRMGRENFKRSGVDLPPVLTGEEDAAGATPKAKDVVAAAGVAGAAYGQYNSYSSGSNGGPPGGYEEPAAIKAARTNASAYTQEEPPAVYSNDRESAYANSSKSAYSNDAEIV